MKGMKGAGIAWIFGILMVLLIVAVFAVGVVSHYNAQVLIVSGAVEAYDTVHVNEFVKRTLDGAAFANGHSAAVSAALGGGGFPVWTDSTPNIEELTAKLGEALGKEMDAIEFNGLTKREIEWADAKAAVTMQDDAGFTFSGNKSFTVASKITTPQTTIVSQGAFGASVKAPYFGLLKTGKAITCPPQEGSAIVNGFERNVTLTGTDMYSVTVLDKPSGLLLRYTLDCTQ